MGLTQEQKQELRDKLQESKVPPRAHNTPLSSLGDQGAQLRAYILGDYAKDAKIQKGAIVVGAQPYLAHSFCRDIVIAGASTTFYYLQTFANRRSNAEEGISQSYVIEWFEQGIDSPFSSKERYLIETRMAGMLDDGITFYLFTAVHPTVSKWWSPQFVEALQENCRIIEVSKDAYRGGGKRTTLSSNKAQGSKNVRRSSRVSVR